MKLFFTFIIIMASTFINAEDTFKRYKFQSGKVYYDVTVSSFDDHLSSQVRGIARLVFDKWGLLELKEEDVAEIQSGDFNDTRHRHTMNKIDGGAVFSVDFDQKVIYKTRDRDLDLAIVQKLDLSDESEKSLKGLGAKMVKKEKIAGYECNLWVYKDQKICLYKGIPLKIVVQNAGFYSEKVAVQVSFDQKVEPSEFKLPDFKIIEDEAYSSSESSIVRTQDYVESIKELKDEMKKKGIDLEDKNLTITPELEKDIINILGKRYLDKQKKYLPKLLEELNKAKECIKMAKSEAEANRCIEPVKKINDVLGDKTQKFDFKNLNDEKRENAIRQINREIKNTQVTANCVTKYDKTTDVIICTEGTLDPE